MNEPNYPLVTLIGAGLGAVVGLAISGFSDRPVKRTVPVGAAISTLYTLAMTAWKQRNPEEPIVAGADIVFRIFILGPILTCILVILSTRK